MAHVRRFGNISVLGASACEKFNVHMKRAYGGTSRRRAARLQDLLMLMERKQRRKKHTMSSEVGTGSKRVILRSLTKFLKEGNGLVQTF